MPTHAIVATVLDRPGIMSGLTTALANHGANITHIDIHPGSPTSAIYLEFELDGPPLEAVLADLNRVPNVESVAETPSAGTIYGKRIIIMGGGAQVGMVAMGAIAEADR